MADQPVEISIRFPARSGYLALSRLNVTAVAAAAGFDIDELDDLRLAIDEAVTWLVNVDGAPPPSDTDGSVELSIAGRSGRLDVRGQHTTGDLDAAAPGDLVHAILGATVDSYETGVDDEGRRYITLAKQSGTNG